MMIRSMFSSRMLTAVAAVAATFFCADMASAQEAAAVGRSLIDLTSSFSVGLVVMFFLVVALLEHVGHFSSSARTVLAQSTPPTNSGSLGSPTGTTAPCNTCRPRMEAMDASMCPSSR